MNRRSILKSVALLPFGAATRDMSFANETKSSMTIDGIEVFQVRANQRPKVLNSKNWVIVRLKTDRGVTGIGEASQGGDDALTLTYLKKFFTMLRGHSIFDIEWFRNATANDILQAGDPAAVAASSLEQCLWDIRGKVFSVPTYEFFGGSIHASLRQYGNINRSTADRSPEGFARMAEKAVAAGMTAIKLAPFDEIPLTLRDPVAVEEYVKVGIARAAAVRQAIGPKIDLMVDVHSRVDLERGLDLVKRLEFLDLFWIEEVTPATPLQNLATIKRKAKMPTAGGESLRGTTGFYPYIKADAAGIIMPDVKVSGGMLEMKMITAIVEGAGLIVSPHGPASPVGNVTAGQVMATASNFNILELSYGENPWRAELISPAEDISHGDLRLSNRSGHGILLNEKTAAKYAAA
jgi:galactonate dehydratase